MRLLTIAAVCVLALLLALTGAGCGGDDEESSGDGDTVTLETTTDDTTTDETTTDDETTDDSDGSLASEDCQELISASAALGTAFSGVQSGDDLSESSEAFTGFAENAPDEIRSDLELMAETYAAYVDALEDIGLDPGETPSAEQAAEFQQALASIDLEEFSAASQRFTTWAGANCQP